MKGWEYQSPENYMVDGFSVPGGYGNGRRMKDLTPSHGDEKRG